MVSRSPENLFSTGVSEMTSGNAVMIRTKKGNKYRETGASNLVDAQKKALGMILSGTSHGDIQVFQRLDLKLNVDISFAPAGEPTNSTTATKLSATKTASPRRPRRGKKRGRTGNLRELISNFLSEQPNKTASLAVIRNALWDAKSTQSGSPRSLYNAISLAVKRYDEFTKTGRGMVKLKK
jgi:hypothetical protein